jgi:hypothetical protein
MTEEERKLVNELFDRLATLEDAQRDSEAERLIRDGLRQAPNAPYALVQTVLVQDEALKRANARIRALEGQGGAPERDAGFLGSMRDSLFGSRERRPSVPSVGPSSNASGMSSAWRTGAQPMTAAPAARLAAPACSTTAAPTIATSRALMMIPMIWTTPASTMTAASMMMADRTFSHITTTLVPIFTRP